MSDPFDVFGGDGCYFCGEPVITSRAGVEICAPCARVYTAEEIAAKRLISHLLKQRKDTNE